MGHYFIKMSSPLKMMLESGILIPTSSSGGVRGIGITCIC
jgi:hypothetical protein